MLRKDALLRFHFGRCRTEVHWTSCTLAEMKYMLRIPLGREECAKRILFCPLSSIACKLSECLSEEELAALSADLVVLSDMLANIIAHQAFCNTETELPECDHRSP